jgi:hypothetical protein
MGQRGRPKEPTGLSPEEQEKRKKELAVKRQQRYRARLKTEKNIAVDAVKEEFRKSLKEIAKQEIQEFQELRGLALSTIRDLLLHGKDRERLTAANMVLSRTDPERKTVQIDIDINPIDLSRFDLRRRNKCIDVQVVECNSPQDSPQPLLIGSEQASAQA